MKNLKNQKGITLVALVITIIVLLILAAVSLSLVAGSNGILTRASGASEENYIATAKEQAELWFAEQTTAYFNARYVDGEVTYTDPCDYFKKIIDAIEASGGNAAKTVQLGDGNTLACGSDKTEYKLYVKKNNKTYTRTYSVDSNTGKINVSSDWQ